MKRASGVLLTGGSGSLNRFISYISSSFSGHQHQVGSLRIRLVCLNDDLNRYRLW